MGVVSIASSQDSLAISCDTSRRGADSVHLSSEGFTLIRPTEATARLQTKRWSRFIPGA